MTEQTTDEKAIDAQSSEFEYILQGFADKKVSKHIFIETLANNSFFAVANQALNEQDTQTAEDPTAEAAQFLVVSDGDNHKTPLLALFTRFEIASQYQKKYEMGQFKHVVRTHARWFIGLAANQSGLIINPESESFVRLNQETVKQLATAYPLDGPDLFKNALSLEAQNPLEDALLAVQQAKLDKQGFWDVLKGSDVYILVSHPWENDLTLAETKPLALACPSGAWGLVTFSHPDRSEALQEKFKDQNKRLQQVPIALLLPNIPEHFSLVLNPGYRQGLEIAAKAITELKQAITDSAD